MTSSYESFHSNNGISSPTLPSFSSSKLNTMTISLIKTRSTEKEEFRSSIEPVLPYHHSIVLRGKDIQDQLPQLLSHPPIKGASDTIEEAFELVVSSITDCLGGDGTDLLVEAMTAETKRKHHRDLQKDDFGLFYEQLSKMRLETSCFGDSFSSDEEDDDDDPLYYHE